MQIEHTFTVQAPIQDLWDLLLDIERVSVCMPGVEQVEALDAETYRGLFKVRVGPISASFSGKVKLLEVDPPNRLVAKAEGNDARSASMVSGSFTAELTGTAEDRTDITYKIDVGIRGPLGRFGQGVMREVAKRLTADFAKCVELQLQGSPARDEGHRS